nr:acyl-coenzyme A oxidase 2, peroxisomal [Tanacetum cinerariifolium]
MRHQIRDCKEPLLNPTLAVVGELLKQYKDKFLMNTYLSQSNPVTTRWEEEDHLRDSKFQLDSFSVILYFFLKYPLTIL